MSTTHVDGDDLFTLGEPALSDERSLGLDRAYGQPAVGEDGNDTSEETLGESWWSEPPLRLFFESRTYFDNKQPEPTGLSRDTSHGENSGGQEVGEDSGQVQTRPEGNRYKSSASV